MKLTVRLKPFIFLIFVLFSLTNSTLLRAQVACYVHERGHFSYIYGFGDVDVWDSYDSYTWYKSSTGNQLSFPTHGVICPSTLYITVKSSGTDSDSHNCSVFNDDQKGSESSSVNATFYTFPTLSTSGLIPANCVSDEGADKYIFTANTSHVLYTGGWITNTYLQIANNASFSNARTVPLPGGTATLSYLDLAGSQTQASAWYGSPLYYRLQFRMSNWNYLYGDTQTQTAFFPNLTLPDDVTASPPDCPGGSPKINIPVSSSEHYIITIKGTHQGAQGYNFNTATLTPSGGYYVITNSTETVNQGQYPILEPGSSYDITVEQGYSEETKNHCADETTVNIPTIPDFTLSFTSFDFNGTDNDGNSVQISKRGSTGRVNMRVEGSKEQTVRIYNNENLIKTVILDEEDDNYGEPPYWNGNFFVDLPKDTHNVNVRNTNCTTVDVSVPMVEPTPITFNLSSSTITCHTSSISEEGKNDGTITINNLSGGIEAYYINGERIYNNHTITELSFNPPLGEYTVRVTDDYGNYTEDTEDVSQNPALNFTVENETAPTLWCLNNGAATVSDPLGGTGGYEYSNVNQLINFSTNNVVGGYMQGTHPVYMKDNSDCIISQDAVIPNAPPQIYVNPAGEDPIPPSCNDYYDGEYHCTVNNVQGTITVSNADPYISPDNITVTDNAITITGLSANNYTLTITDTYNGHSCSISKSFTILPKPAITINPSVTPVSDKGTATGAIEIEMSTGNPGTREYILYDENEVQINSISSELDIETFSGLAGEYANAGKIYYIDIVDSKSCSYSEDNNGLYQFRIQEPQDTLKIGFEITDSIDCHLYDNGEITLSAEGGWTGLYEYKSDIRDWSTNNVFSDYSEGNYYFYVKDQYGGTDTFEVYFSQPTPLTAVHNSTSNVLCNGTNTGWLRYNVSGGSFPYTFVQNQSDEIFINGEDTFLIATQLSVGTYQLNIEDRNACVTTDLTNSVSEPDELAIPYTSVNHTSCELDNGEIEARANGGTAPYNYRWTNLNSLTVYNHTNYQATETSIITDIPAGDYQLEVTDSNNCSESSNILSVNPYTNPIIVSDQITDVRCYGESNGEIVLTANAGTSNIQNYTIESVSSVYSDSNATGTFTNLLTDSYLLYVFDINSCRSNIPYSVIVNQPDTIVYSITDTIVPVSIKGTNTGSIHSKVYGGNIGLKDITLFDSDDIQINQKSERYKFPVHFDNLYKGDYYLNIIDIKGCTYNSPIQTVEEPQLALGFTVTEKEDAMCKSQTGSFTVEGYGGWGDYSYKRSIDNGFYDISSFKALYAGSYIVSVKDKYGAVFTDTVIIYEPKDSLQASLIDYTNPTCNENGSFSLNLKGGVAPYKLVFDGSTDTTDISNPQDFTFTNRPDGAYLLHLTDNNGCKFDLETSLSDQNLLNITEFNLTHPSSVGANDGVIESFVNGGKSPLSYSWRELFGNPLTETSSVLSNVSSDHYELTVSESDGCSVTERVFLPDVVDTPLEIIVLTHETSFQAQNGTVQLLSPLEEMINVELISPQGTRTVYDINDSNSDFNEEANIIYLNNLSGGTYFVMATNNSGEKAYAEFEIEAYEQFLFDDIIITHAKEIDDQSGSINVIVAGGAGGNRFVWKYLDGNVSSLDTVNNEYTGSLRNAVAGNYRITVTDKFNNSISETLIIEQPGEPLEITISEFTNESCKDYEDSYVVLQASGGWGDYQFKHDIEEYYSNNDNRLNLDVREHYFYLTDKMGAVDSIAITITEPDYLRANVELVDSVDCKSAIDGNILFDITGGTEPYSYAFEELSPLWTQDTTARNLAEGTYTFIFTDSNNCIGQDTLSVYMPEPDSLLFNNIDIIHTTCDTDNGTMTVVMQGGTQPFRYEWTNFEGSILGTENTISGLNQNSRYYINVLDAHDCSQYYEQLINPSTNPLVLDVDTTPVICNGEYTGTAHIVDVLPAEPYAPYSFTWSNDDEGETTDGLEAGIHTVTITDENNCSTTKFFEVTEPDTIQVVVTDFKDAHCFGYNDAYIEVLASGGVGNYQFNWSTGQTTERVESLYKGVYELTITDSNNCSIQETYEIIEPEELLVDLGENIEICPGSSVTIDGQEYTTYQWSDSDGVLSNERFITTDKEDEYFLEVTNSIGCFARDEILVSIGNDALQADFLMSSQANLGDTLFIYEISNLETDSISWEYDNDVFTNIVEESEPSYILQLQSNETGIFNIGLAAYSGGCTSTIVKQVEIVQYNDTVDGGGDLGYSDPIILEVLVYPNPTDGNFTLKVELRETADIELTIFSVNYGVITDQRSAYGEDYYEIDYNLNTLNTGVYVIMVTANNERKQTKIIVNRE